MHFGLVKALIKHANLCLGVVTKSIRSCLNSA